MRADLADLASRLITARRTGSPVPPDALPVGDLTDRDAYAVQALVAQALGPVGGFKVACKPGHPRIMAPILARDIIGTPARLAVPASERIGIELELGFRVLAPLPPADVPDRDARLADCLALVPVIEIVRTRLAGEAAPMLKLADNQINGALVVGPELPDWRGRDLSRVTARLTAGGRILLDGPADVPGLGAFENFKVLEALVGDHCGGLRPGHVVITGSLNGLPWLRPGTAIEGRIEGVGAVALALEPRG
ncbi:MAG: fumarylacetoacetate hydrolase family protein [Rhodovulum sp.]